MPKAKEKDIAEIAAERRGALMQTARTRLGKDRVRMGDDPALLLATESTDIPALDAILGGGWRRGRFGLIVGDYSMGKTLLTQWTIAAFQRRGLVCGFLDPEKTFDAEWFEATGVNVQDLIVARPESTEQAFDLVSDWVEQHIDLAVVDSLAALVPQRRSSTSLSEQEVMGLNAAKIAEGIQAVNNKNQDSFVLCTNQLRSKLGVVYGSPDEIPGGRAQKFYASYVVQTRRAGWITDGGKKRLGYNLRVETLKSKLTAPFQECTLPFMFTGVIDTLTGLIEIALELDVVTVSDKGGYYSWAGNKYHGHQAFRDCLADPDNLAALKAEIEFSELPEPLEEVAVE